MYLTLRDLNLNLGWHIWKKDTFFPSFYFLPTSIIFCAFARTSLSLLSCLTGYFGHFLIFQFASVFSVTILKTDFRPTSFRGSGRLIDLIFSKYYSICISSKSVIKHAIKILKPFHCRESCKNTLKYKPKLRKQLNFHHSKITTGNILVYIFLDFF